MKTCSKCNKKTTKYGYSKENGLILCKECKDIEYEKIVNRLSSNVSIEDITNHLLKGIHGL